MSVDRIVGEALAPGHDDLERTTRDILKFVPVGTHAHDEVHERIGYVLSAIGQYETRIARLAAELASYRHRYHVALGLLAAVTLGTVLVQASAVWRTVQAVLHWWGV